MAHRSVVRLVVLAIVGLLCSLHCSAEEVAVISADTADLSLGSSWKLLDTSLPLPPLPFSSLPSLSPITVPSPLPSRHRSMTDLVDDLPSPCPSSSSPPLHSFRPLQAGAAFTATRRTAMAPFSPRIQPGLMYRTREIAYTQLRTNIQIRLGAGYLLLYEGAMTNRSGGPTLAVENDVSESHTPPPQLLSTSRLC